MSKKNKYKCRLIYYNINGGVFMATSSFNEKVVVSNPEIVKEMQRTLNDASVVMFNKKPNMIYTVKQARENARKWTLK